MGLPIRHSPYFSAEMSPLGELCRRIFLEQLNRVNESRFLLRVPQLRDHIMEHPGLHFHFTPDLVIALRGRTCFEFIHESFTLSPGEMAIIPEGIPHREVLPASAEPFENLIVSVYNQTLCVLHQFQNQNGNENRINGIGEGTIASRTEYFDTPQYEPLAHYLGEIAQLSPSVELEHRMATKGLLLAHLSTLESIAKRPPNAIPFEKLKISQAKRQVREHLGNSALSVKELAESLHCSSDYLSNLFHRETGQRLIGYINRERIQAATGMLRNTPLTISEIAFAVGFESPGYFSRVFRQILFKTPLEYRKALERTAVELEGHPQAIYAA